MTRSLRIPPPPATSTSIRAPRPIHASLDNNLAVRALQRPRLPIVDVLLLLPAGAAIDRTGTAGRAALTADLLDSGTHGKTQIDIAQNLDALGARLSIHSHWDCTGISLQVLPDNLPAALDVLADMVQNASFPEAEFERGRTEQLASIQQDLDDPEALAASAIARAIFGTDHIYGVPRGGTRSTVERLDRNALVQCHTAGYRPAGAIVFAVGDMAPEMAVAEFERALGDWRGNASHEADTPSQVGGRTRRIHIVDRPDAPQSELRLGAVGAARSSPDYFPLVVLNTILGGSFTSRLNTRLREEGGYTYGAFSTFSFRQSPGPFVAGAAVFTEATARALAETLEEMERLREELVPAAELDRARNYLTLGLARGFEQNAGIASRLADVDLYGLGEDHWDRYTERINAVDAETVLAAARRYLDTTRLNVVVVGDRATVRAPLEALGIGPVVDMAPE